MPWLLLIVAGLLEVGWASVLPSTDGFTRLWPTAAFLALMAGSMFGLAKATETIPLATGYVVWVGIGAVGTVIVGLLRGDPLSLTRIACLALIVGGVVGLKVTGSH
ncbi:DMT family transporter [Aquihabitans daechungensis]|uniref:DMT family transporter n=1 Tax=Aquihabitans daechungensis TaxID=1052257 RepID=UPI003B9F84C2